MCFLCIASKHHFAIRGAPTKTAISRAQPSFACPLSFQSQGVLPLVEPSQALSIACDFSALMTLYPIEL